MKLKTYTASTMAQALAQVRKDLGTDAMILHTRSYRTGSWLGLGGKPMVEITASSPQPTKSRKTRRAKRTRVVEPVEQSIERSELVEESIPEIVVQRSRVAQPITQHREHPVASVPQALPDAEEPIDDRAALLQGLMGGTEPLKRDRRFDSIQRRSVEQPVKPPAPREDFEPTTFRSIDPLDSIEPDEPVLLKEETTDDADQFLVEEGTVEREPLIQETAESVFETATIPIGQKLSPEPASEPNTASPDAESLQLQIQTLQKMMGQVLDTTRRTAVAVNKTNPDGALPPVEMSAPLHALYTGMIDNDVAVDLADRFIGAVRDRLDADELNDASVVRHALLREIESSIETTSESLLTTTPVDGAARDRPQVIALIGPTGVGKTTTVAKLAATAKLRHGKQVALITSDTFRIAAVEQLRTYASIIGLQLRIANSPEEMRDQIASLNDVDLVVIDTAGRSQNNHARLDELGQLIAAAQPDETHLVLSSTVGDNVLRKTAERFMGLGPDRCILTKIDEAVTTGMIAGMRDRIGLPLSYVTVGQEVPDDILPARADRLARAVLDGPQAVVPGL